MAKYVRLGAIRVPFAFLMILNFWFALQAFGADVPFLAVLAYVPIILFISTIPITVAGLGTVQAATIYLFRPYATEAQLLAFSLALAAVLIASRALLGIPCFQSVSADLIGDSEPGRVEKP